MLNSFKKHLETDLATNWDKWPLYWQPDFLDFGDQFNPVSADNKLNNDILNASI